MGRRFYRPDRVRSGIPWDVADDYTDFKLRLMEKGRPLPADAPSMSLPSVVVSETVWIRGGVTRILVFGQQRELLFFLYRHVVPPLRHKNRLSIDHDSAFVGSDLPVECNYIIHTQSTRTCSNSMYSSGIILPHCGHSTYRTPSSTST